MIKKYPRYRWRFEWRFFGSPDWLYFQIKVQLFVLRSEVQNDIISLNKTKNHKLYQSIMVLTAQDNSQSLNIFFQMWLFVNCFANFQL